MSHLGQFFRRQWAACHTIATVAPFPPRPYFYLGRNWGFTQLASGERFYVNTDDHSIAAIIIMYGVWEVNVETILREVTRQGDTCLDVGANLGYFTVKLAGYAGPTGTVLAFEPNPELYPFLAENIATNVLVKAKAFDLGLGAKRQTITLTFERRYSGGGTVVAGGGSAEACAIQIDALDDMPTCPRQVDVIKIDIEGGEPNAFAGMKQLLARSPDCVVVTEFDYGRWSLSGDPKQIMQNTQQERRLFWIEEDGTLVPDDGSLRQSRESISNALLINEHSDRFQSIRPRIKSLRSQSR